MKEIKIVELLGSDWEGLYFNNECITQGHSLNENDLFKYLIKSEDSFKFVSHETFELSDETIEDWGYSLPSILTDDHWVKIKEDNYMN